MVKTGRGLLFVCTTAGRGPFVSLYHGGTGPLQLFAPRWGGAPPFVCTTVGWGPFDCLHLGGAGPLVCLHRWGGAIQLFAPRWGGGPSFVCSRGPRLFCLRHAGWVSFWVTVAGRGTGASFATTGRIAGFFVVALFHSFIHFNK